MRIQIIVPIYNEGENVLRLYDNLCAINFAFDELKFVYDYEEDTTLPYLAELSARNKKVVYEKNELGKGVINALKWGFSRAIDGPVFILMGDNSDKLEIMPKMIEFWNNGSTIVSPSRYMKGGKQHGGGLLKSSLSMLAGKSLYFIGFPTSDPTNNFKLYDGKWLSKQKIESDGGFEVGLELSYKAYYQNRTISQLPTEWWDRTEGQSNFKLFKWLPKYIRWYLKCVKLLFKNTLGIKT